MAGNWPQERVALTDEGKVWTLVAWARAVVAGSGEGNTRPGRKCPTLTRFNDGRPCLGYEGPALAFPSEGDPPLWPARAVTPSLAMATGHKPKRGEGRKKRKNEKKSLKIQKNY